MAESGNGALSARKRRDMNGGDSHSPVKKIKLEDDDPPEANPNTIEAVRHKNKEMALDLLEKNRRIAFLTHKCASLFRQNAMSHRAFRCIQRQWIHVVDDLKCASSALNVETPDAWRDVFAKTESLGVLTLPSDVVSVALPEWFLAISRGDTDVELKQNEDDDEGMPEATSASLDDKEKKVQQALQDEHERVNEAVQKLLAAIGSGNTKEFELKELVDQKRVASAQVLELKDELETMKRKLADMQTDLEAKEVERHRACRALDRLKDSVEKHDRAAMKETANGVSAENGGDHAANDGDSSASQRAGEKRVTLVDPETKPAVDPKIVRRLNADIEILVRKLKDERHNVETMRPELNRLRAFETASKQEETRLKQEFEATVTRLQDEKATLEEQLAALRQQEDDQQTSCQDQWKAHLDRIQEDATKAKSKVGDLVFKNTALRDKLASFSVYRDQLAELKSEHESLKKEAERLQENLKREKARNKRDEKVEENKRVIELRETLALAEKERDDLQARVAQLTASLEKSGDEKLADSLSREKQACKALEDLRSELANAKMDAEKALAELDTAQANQDAFKDENDALVAEIERLGKEVETARQSKKKVVRQLDEKRQSAKKYQSEAAKESDARQHASEELATIRLQVSSLKYVHTQQKAALEAAKEAQKTLEQELSELKRTLQTVQTERETLAAEKLKAEKDADVSNQMYKAESIHKQRLVLQDKSRPCDKCEAYRKKEADYEDRIAKLRAASGSSGGASSGLSDLERFELQDLRKQLKCSVCQDRHKNVIISKCSHLFCKECVDSNLKSRNRKCPTCKKMFGQDDVKSVWFT